MFRTFLFVLAATLVPAAAGRGEVYELQGHLLSPDAPLPLPAYLATFSYLPAQQEAYFSYTPVFCNECPQATPSSPQSPSPPFGIVYGDPIDVPVNLYFAVEQNDADDLVIHYLTPATDPSPFTVQFDLTLDKQLANGNWFFNVECPTCSLLFGTSNVDATITSFRLVPEPDGVGMALLAGLVTIVGICRSK